MKKFSEMKQSKYRLELKDVDGDIFYLDHINEINSKQVSDITRKYKNNSVLANFELIKLLVHGENFEVDLDTENDLDTIKEIMGNPNQVILKLIIEIYKMIMENTNGIYEITESMSNVNPKLLKEAEKIMNKKLEPTDEELKQIEEFKKRGLL